MTDETPPSKRRVPTGRRAVLRTVAAVSIGGSLASRRAVADGETTRYTVSQGGDTYEVEPLAGDVPVEEFYDLRIPDEFGGDNGATDPGEGPYYMSVGTTGLQRESTTITFLYDGPKGLSLVVVHDAESGDGGSATWTVSGDLGGLEWLVKDDYYTDSETGEQADSNLDNWQTSGDSHRIDWTWRATRGDGGVLGYLGDDPDLTVTPRFNEEAALFDSTPYSGTIDAWEFLSGDVETPERIPLALDEELEIGRSEATEKQPKRDEEGTEGTDEGEEDEGNGNGDRGDERGNGERGDDRSEERDGNGNGKGRDNGRGRGNDEGRGNGRDDDDDDDDEREEDDDDDDDEREEDDDDDDDEREEDDDDDDDDDEREEDDDDEREEDDDDEREEDDDDDDDD